MRIFRMMALATLLATPAFSASIERYPAPAGGPAPILKAVQIPAGSDLMFVAGQLAAPIDPKIATGPDTPVEALGDTETQLISALSKVKAIAEAHGYTMSDVVKLVVYVAADPKLGRPDLRGMNEGFKQFFGTAQNPSTVARTSVQVLGFSAPAYLVEVEATVARSR